MISYCPFCLTPSRVPVTSDALTEAHCPHCAASLELPDISAEASLKTFLLSPNQTATVDDSYVSDSLQDAGLNFDDADEFQFTEVETEHSILPTAAPINLEGSPRVSRRPRKTERSTLASLIPVVFGGFLAIPLATAICWYGLGKDPLGFGPQIAAYVPWIVPEKFSGRASYHTPSNALSERTNQLPEIGSANSTVSSSPATTSSAKAIGNSLPESETEDFTITSISPEDTPEQEVTQLAQTIDAWDAAVDEYVRSPSPETEQEVIERLNSMVSQLRPDFQGSLQVGMQVDRLPNILRKIPKKQITALAKLSEKHAAGQVSSPNAILHGIEIASISPLPIDDGDFREVAATKRTPAMIRESSIIVRHDLAEIVDHANFPATFIVIGRYIQIPDQAKPTVEILSAIPY